MNATSASNFTQPKNKNNIPNKNNKCMNYKIALNDNPSGIPNDP